MTPSEKAIELVDYFMAIVKDLEVAKKCAVKVCEETYKIACFYETEVFYTKLIEQIKAIR